MNSLSKQPDGGFFEIPDGFCNDYFPINLEAQGSYTVVPKGEITITFPSASYHRFISRVQVHGDGSTLLEFDGNPTSQWVTGENYSASDYNKLVNETLDWLYEKPSCAWCRSEYHDAKYHPGTCMNCGGPAGK